MMLGLPGSAYLYNGEELGLPDHTALPDEVRQDPAFHRTAGEEIGRDGFAQTEAKARRWRKARRRWISATSSGGRRWNLATAAACCSAATRFLSFRRWSCSRRRRAPAMVWFVFEDDDAES